MKRIFILFSFALFVAGGAFAQAMSDNEVVAYVKSGLAQGKQKKAIYNELVAKGVSTTQLQRIKDKYEQQQSNVVANKGMWMDQRTESRFSDATSSAQPI